MPQRRRGFTLIELLVSMALVIFIMAILSEAFVCCAKAFRDFKSTGDMAERLRSAAKLIRSDLAADHFEGKKRLSQPDFWLNGPPLEGFFRIYNGTNINTHLEGVDLEGIPSYLVSDHSVHFTVKLRGNSRDQFFMAQVPGNSALFGEPNPDRRFQDTPATFNGQWAEVAWFLAPTYDAQGNPDATPLIPGTAQSPLYGLYRRQRVAVPERMARVNLGSTNGYSEVSNFQATPAGGGSYSCFACSARDLTVPSRRFGMAQSSALSPNFQAGVFPPGNSNNYPTLSGFTSDKILGTSDPTRANADQVIADVLSFEVRFLPGSTMGIPPANDFVDLYNSAIRNYRNSAKGLSNNPAFQGNPHVFDTWSQLAEGNGTVLNGPAPDNSFATYGVTQTNPAAPFSNTVPNWRLPGSPLSIPTFANKSNPNDMLLIRAVQITIRIWDFNTSQSRQITIIQDM